MDMLPQTEPAAEPQTTPERLAFFDVDETVVRFKTMFDFDAFWSRHVGTLSGLVGPIRHRFFMRRMTSYVKGGRSREFINAYYYNRFALRSQAQTRQMVARWFENAKRMPDGIYIPAVVDAIRRHRQDGVKIVLVSGSFHELLEPIAQELKVDHVLATRLEVAGDRYTGRIEPPQMIGVGKALAARMLLAQRNADPATCWAYGDHISDVALLEEVGHPNIVSSEPSMLALAGERGWNVIPPGLTQLEQQKGL